MAKKLHLIGPFAQVVTMAGIGIKGPINDKELNIVENGGIVVDGDLIIEVAEYEHLYQKYKSLSLAVTKILGDKVALPGLIDAHTHICFGGSRARDYAMRNTGRTYLEIAKAGGGIWDTVHQTRKLNASDLTQGVIKRCQKIISLGITTVEVKSGYGLSVSEELKMLRAINIADRQTAIDIIPTCLAAHIFPKDYDGSIADYLNEISRELFPVMRSENLSNRVDAFIESEAYTAEVIAPYLNSAKTHHFDITIHADQFHTGGSKVAVDFEAVSADHLEASRDKEIELLAKSNVVATALPGASIGLGCNFTPARKLLDAGAALAIASDWNPGSAPMGDLLTQAAVLGTFEKLSNAEVLSGITFRAAAALRLYNLGRLVPDFKADFIAFPTDNYQEILYRQGQIKPDMVWKGGVLIAQN